MAAAAKASPPDGRDFSSQLPCLTKMLLSAMAAEPSCRSSLDEGLRRNSADNRELARRSPPPPPPPPPPTVLLAIDEASEPADAEEQPPLKDLEKRASMLRDVCPSWLRPTPPPPPPLPRSPSPSPAAESGAAASGSDTGAGSTK